MEATFPATTTSRGTLWTGIGLSGFAILFLLWDSIIKIMLHPIVLETMKIIDVPERLAMIIGIEELICVLVYLFPRTAVFGAVLLTGHLGGATAIQLRSGAPAFNIVFPAIIGLLIWGGLLLREPRLRALFPWRS